jgi:hypothetical protein
MLDLSHWENPASSYTQLMCLKRGGVHKVDRLLTGRSIPPKVPTGMAEAILIDLDPVEDDGNTPISSGSLRITKGPHKDKVVQFDRANYTVFGKAMARSDITNLIHPQDKVLVTEPTKRRKVMKVILGPADLSSTDPQEMSSEERLEFITWLSVHLLTYPEYLNVLEGKTDIRPYVPFNRDNVMQGRIVNLLVPKQEKRGGALWIWKIDGRHFTATQYVSHFIPLRLQ